MDTGQLAVGALAAVSAGGVAYALIYPLLSGEARGEKRQAVAARGAAPARVAVSARMDAAGRKQKVAESLKELEARQDADRRVTLDDRIAQAGLAWSRQRYWTVSAALAVVLGLLALLASGSPIVAGLGLVAGGLGAPRWYLSLLRSRRTARFIAELPNAMDVIVRGVRSGLPLGDCVRIIAAEAVEPVRGEFRQIVEAQTLGVPLGDACAAMYNRMPTQEANFFGIVIQIQSKSGGNLSEALGNLSKVLRERKKMKGKIVAMSMEAKASAAIIGALPFIVAVLVYVSSPTYIEKLWSTQAGLMTMGVSGVWMAMGCYVMKKMCTFEI